MTARTDPGYPACLGADLQVLGPDDLVAVLAQGRPQRLGHAGESGVEQPDAEPQGSPLLLLTHNRNYRPPAHPQAVPGGTARMCP